ncbi:MAG: Glycine cleavage system transcriptional antiactivator GcvR [Rhodanobacteraceae bacterium]|nr:MAG: Glycine cleavage system transcriptional antiactivator GcvR [Rhodanobacteraceae bacterium]
MNVKPLASVNRPTARPATDHQLLIQAVAPARQSPLLVLSRRIADAGCNLVESRVATVGADVSVLLLAKGAWDAIAKLENALGRIGRDDNLHLLSYRTQSSDQPSHLLPYMVEVIAADKTGVLVELIDFFNRRKISIEQMSSMRYQAMQTGAEMFQAQITIGIPADTRIAELRDEFMELCDGLNLDAIMDPVKF